MSREDKQVKGGVQATQLDEHMKLQGIAAEGLVWHSPDNAPFRLAGFPWFGQDGRYARLPERTEETLPPAVVQLAACTAGGQIHMRTDSTRLALRVKLAGVAGMYHMPATGQCGFDCYLGPSGEKHYLSTTRYDHKLDAFEADLWKGLPKELRHVTINFPLYQGVEEVSIGLDEDAVLLPPEPYVRPDKVVLYGTSITQGGCASRPGMAYTNIVSRNLNLEFVNLGFSGSGKGEPEVARTIAGIPDPALYVLDYEANCGDYDRLAETMPAFIRILRDAHPEVPILVVSRIVYPNERFYPEAAAARLRRRELQSGIVASLREQGDRNVHFLDGESLMGIEGHEGTVDACHPTDLGFSQMAQGIEPKLRELLGL
ncbi:N-terminus of Esterase_SGNH_hydro-type [Paenibacillus sp. UNCCL117]|uniref:SGNH/GDSL hydrolase family protein n=1 Tax=unclassified Paenibacillus TaxID=185978 RepID=UPI00087E6E1C|nr:MULTISPECIES: SGNH/GDSL hydrolase family protein [unclassified Paenibacillus]SDE22276.1 N-terminus of Esterase_SGNH_hydro-type [Paenibacillus sp. cl123]SFW43018.1 N-terminus of Esterase_SGNH_hydro-type [Paenibacillus sp. UNCCL117]